MIAAVGTGKAWSPPSTAGGTGPAGSTQPLGWLGTATAMTARAPAALEQSRERPSEPKFSANLGRHPLDTEG